MNSKNKHYNLKIIYSINKKTQFKQGIISHYPDNKLIGLLYDFPNNKKDFPSIFLGLRKQDQIFFANLSHVITREPPIIGGVKSDTKTNQDYLSNQYSGLLKIIDFLPYEISFFEINKNKKIQDFARELKQIPVSELNQTYFKKDILKKIKKSTPKEDQIVVRLTEIN